MNSAVTSVAFRLAFAALVFHLVLVQPNHPGAMTWQALLVFPLELPVILLALLALGASRTSLVVRVVLVATLTAIMVLKSADYVMFSALNRGFNLVGDLPLVGSLVQLVSGSFGALAGIAAIIGAALATVLVGWLLWWASGVWSALNLKRVASRWAAISALVFVGTATAEIGNAMGRWSVPEPLPGAAFTARVGLERIALTRATLADLRTFRAAAVSDIYAGTDGLLDLIDSDVLVVFVESYGRTSFDTPFFADVHRQTLMEAQTELGALGLAMASTFVASPTRGGQSWLAHATFANGLWIDGQTSYRAALASGRDTLFHIAARSGFRTGAIMPQITLEWPEAQFMGFESVFPARDLGYAGLPFNWVTMPDQFTLAALDRLLLDPAESYAEPLFAQIVLGSSHAPWVPVPNLVDWDAIGDGSIFNAMAASGDAPNIVWRDRDRVRLQYRLAINYALQTVFAYAARHADAPPLMIVVGDHQAAGFVALDERPDVPIHVIGPAHLVERMVRHDFHVGLLPPAQTRVRPMADMRDLILEAFSSDPPRASAR